MIILRILVTVPVIILCTIYSILTDYKPYSVHMHPNLFYCTVTEVGTQVTKLTTNGGLFIRYRSNIIFCQLIGQIFTVISSKKAEFEMMMTKIDTTNNTDTCPDEHVASTHRMIMKYHDEKIELHAQTLEEHKTVITNVATKQIVIIFWHVVISNIICGIPLLVQPLGTETKTFGVLAVLLQSLLLYMVFPFGNSPQKNGMM